MQTSCFLFFFPFSSYLVQSQNHKWEKNNNNNNNKKQEDHDGPISLTWPNRFVHLLLEVSTKFTALGFLYKLYSTNHPHPAPPHPRPCFFTNLDDLNCLLKEGHQRNISAKLYSWLSLSRTRLSRITAYLEVKIWSLPKHEDLTTGKKYCGKEEKLLLRSNFSSFPQYFQYISNFRSQITHIFVKCG